MGLHDISNKLFMLKNVLIDVCMYICKLTHWACWLYYMQFPLDNRENKTCKMSVRAKYLLAKNFYLYSTLIGTYLAGLITKTEVENTVAVECPQRYSQLAVVMAPLHYETFIVGESGCVEN